MKALRMLIAAFALSVWCSLALAAPPEGKWTLNNMNFNQGNKYFAGSVGPDNYLMAIGAEADGQGGTKLVFRKSTNEGKSFGDITIPTNGGMFQFFTDVQVINKNLAWVAGMEIGMTGNVGGPVWKVTNDGRDAEMQVLIWGEFPECSKIYCTDGNHCWTGCADGLVGYTSDGGENWQTSTLPVTDLTVGAIYFTDNSNGWIRAHKVDEEQGDEPNDPPTYTYLERGTTFRTTNGGKDWTVLTDGEKGMYTKLFMVNNQIGFADVFDGTRSYLSRTLDGGENWFILPLPPSQTGPYGSAPLYTVGGIHFFDENRGWVAASYGEKESGMGSILFMFYTEDQGDNWTPYQIWYLDANTQQDTVLPGIVYAMSFINEHRGYVFGEMQTVAVWDDGQFDPPTDGDEPDGDAPDGDGGAEDGDMDEDTGPIYTGAPGEPCPQPGNPESYALPRCDGGQGSPLCAWADGLGPHCTDFCTYNEDCRKFGPDSCCKVITFEGASQGVCLVDAQLCPSYPDNWHGYKDALVGETCKIKDNPSWASYPSCDKNYGGSGCLLIPNEPPTFCSMACASDADCTGGFTTEGCCNLAVGDATYCQFDERCNPDWTPDGDEPVEDGDVPSDGDVPVDGDTPADGDDGGAGETGGGGCNGAAGGPLVLLALASLWAVRRKR
jgi:photosystem II stability/assembly factor-like uncharacterized protein